MFFLSNSGTTESFINPEAASFVTEHGTDSNVEKVSAGEIFENRDNPGFDHVTLDVDPNTGKTGLTQGSNGDDGGGDVVAEVTHDVPESKTHSSSRTSSEQRSKCSSRRKARKMKNRSLQQQSDHTPLFGNKLTI